jgi:hypothetical protein
VARPKTEKKSIFSFLLFDSGSQPSPAMAGACGNSVRSACQAPINNIVDEPVIPEAAVNTTSEVTYQNVSSLEMTSSMASSKKSQKRPFYSFLLFDDELQKNPVTASTSTMKTQTAVRPTVINYPVAEPPKAAPAAVENAPSPAPVAASEVRQPLYNNVVAAEPKQSPAAAGSTETSNYPGIVIEDSSADAENPDSVIAAYLTSKKKQAAKKPARFTSQAPDLAWLEFVRRPLVQMSETPVSNPAPVSSVLADSIYIRNRAPAQPVAQPQAPARSESQAARTTTVPSAESAKKPSAGAQFKKGCVFTNSLVNEQIKNDIKRLLSDY